MKDNILSLKSFAFAVRTLKLMKYLDRIDGGYIVGKQIARSGTSIGAMISESEHAESRKDFVHKLNLGLKEANETRYWLELLFETGYISKRMFESLYMDCEELIKLLAASVKTARNNLRSI